MKKFIEPEMTIATFAIEDVITTSGGEDAPVDPDQGEII